MNHKRSFSFFHLFSTASAVLAEVFRAGRVAFRLRASWVAENLFLRKQLAFYRDRQVKPRRLTDQARLLLILWSLWFDWKNEARHPGIATNRARLLAGRSKSQSRSLLPALDDLCAKPCPGHRGL